MKGRHHINEFDYSEKKIANSNKDILKLIKAEWFDRNIAAYLQVRLNRVAKIRKEYNNDK